MTCFLRELALRLMAPVAGVIMLSTAVTSVAQVDSGERAVIDIIQIMHRDPDRIREAIRLTLDPRGSIGQIDDKLIIATTATNLEQIRGVITDTDVPPRRLIIGVDFAYSPDSDQEQQQSQAIEGQELVFLGTTDVPDASDIPRITIAAEIINNAASESLAAVNLSLANVPELAGNHIIRVPLGVWQRIDMPAPARGTENASDDGASADSGVGTEASGVVAVRIDRVP